MSPHLAVPAWEEDVPESSLGYRIPPRSDEWRLDFDCGDGPFADEVRDMLAHGQWYDWDPAPQIYEFGTDEAVIAFLIVGVLKAPHPTRTSTQKKVYVTLDYIAVGRSFQGEKDTAARPEERFADVIMRHVEDGLFPLFAGRNRRKMRGRNAVGLYAIVRVGNIAACRLLERHGFAADADGPFRDGQTQQPSILYRKVLDPSAR